MLLVFVAACGTDARHYGSDGPEHVTEVSVSVSAPSDAFTLSLYLPSTSGAHPMVFLSSGLLQPATAYSDYGQRLASWGIIAALRDDPGLNTTGQEVADDLVYLVGTWLPMQNAMTGSPLYRQVDLNRVGLAGHSRGGEASLLAAEGGAHGQVKALFGLDPVDEPAPAGAAANLSTIGIPLAFIGETTDDGANDCAPAPQNYQALYAAAASPAVALTAVGADHTMFELPSDCLFCSLCTPGTAQQPVVASEAARYLMAFFARELQGDSSVGPTFEGAGLAADIKAGTITVVSK